MSRPSPVLTAVLCVTTLSACTQTRYVTRKIPERQAVTKQIPLQAQVVSDAGTVGTPIAARHAQVADLIEHYLHSETALSVVAREHRDPAPAAQTVDLTQLNLLVKEGQVPAAEPSPAAVPRLYFRGHLTDAGPDVRLTLTAYEADGTLVHADARTGTWPAVVTTGMAALISHEGLAAQTVEHTTYVDGFTNKRVAVEEENTLGTFLVGLGVVGAALLVVTLAN